MDINIILSYDENPEMNINNFKPYEIDFTEADKLLKAKGKWVLAQFENNYRKSENYVQNTINAIAIDVDDGLSIEEFKEIAKKYKYYLGTTKSHQKLKNNKICDRYRVIFPLETYFNLSVYEYSLMMSEINRQFCADQACKDLSRQFRGYPNAEVYLHNEGELLGWQNYLNKAIKRIRISEYCDELRYKYQHKDFTINGDATKFFMYAKKKFDRIYYTGNRNNAVANIVLWGKKENIDYELLCNKLNEWVHNTNDPLPQRELSAIFRSHR